jgi:hypothetical protein
VGSASQAEKMIDSRLAELEAEMLQRALEQEEAEGAEQLRSAFARLRDITSHQQNQREQQQATHYDWHVAGDSEPEMDGDGNEQGDKDAGEMEVDEDVATSGTAAIPARSSDGSAFASSSSSLAFTQDGQPLSATSAAAASRKVRLVLHSYYFVF